MVRTRSVSGTARRARGGGVPMQAIRKFARQVAARFEPDKIILFGSHAYGTPRADSDVDLLVVMDTRNRNQASRIRLAIPRDFPMDLIVRRPREIQRALEEEDWFLRDIMAKGIVLHEKTDAPVGAQGRRGLDHGPPRRRPRSADQG